MREGIPDHLRMGKRGKWNTPQSGEDDHPAPFLGAWIYRLGTTPRKIVEATKINEGYLSELINGGKRNPSDRLLKVIAAHLGVPVDTFRKPPPSESAIEQVSHLDPAILARLKPYKS